MATAPPRIPPPVEAYGGGGFRIGGERIEGSALVLDDAARPWAAPTLSALTPADFAPVFAAPEGLVELVILGVGHQALPAPRPVREALARAGLGLEVLSTPEACRLYNLLSSDGRRVAAALLAI